MTFDTPTALMASAGAIILFNVIVTRTLILDAGTTAVQKLFQACLIWLIPVLGGTLILYLIASHHDRAEMANLAPWPFYLVAVPPHREVEDGVGSSADNVAEGACGEGGCGGD